MSPLKNGERMWPRGAWTPKREGAVYCSPACGGRERHGCTWQAHLQAKSRARAMAKLLGPGWTWKVYENLGWHYAVERGGCSLSETTQSSKGTHRRPAYMLIVNSVLGSDTFHGPNPRALVAQARTEFGKRLAAAATQVEAMFVS